MHIIKVHIFSFDRAAQLNLLLDSIAEFDKESNFKILVQYCFSNEQFLHGYELLISKFPNILFINEIRYSKLKVINPFFGAIWFNVLYWTINKRFKYTSSNFREILLESIADESTDYCMFLTDDSLFYRDIEINKEVLSDISINKSHAYSLALGKNIVNGDYVLKNNFITHKLERKYLGSIWEFPFSVDGRIYERKNLLQIIKKISFSNPNTFESVLVAFNKFIKVFDYVNANNKSSLVGFELNRVQQVYENNSLQVNTAEINKYYLDGFKLFIDFEKENITVFRPEIKKLLLERNREAISLL